MVYNLVLFSEASSDEFFTAAWTSKRKKGKNSRNLVIVVIGKRGSIGDN